MTIDFSKPTIAEGVGLPEDIKDKIINRYLDTFKEMVNTKPETVDEREIVLGLLPWLYNLGFDTDRPQVSFILGLAIGEARHIVDIYVATHRGLAVDYSSKK